MKTQVRIFKPAKSAMQSGHGGRSDKWHLQGMPLSAHVPEHLMGWVSADGTSDQISMVFDCKTAAVSFAESQGWIYEIHDPEQREVLPRNYLDNFKYRPVAYHPVKAEKNPKLARSKKS